MAGNVTPAMKLSFVLAQTKTQKNQSPPTQKKGTNLHAMVTKVLLLNTYESCHRYRKVTKADPHRTCYQTPSTENLQKGSMQKNQSPLIQNLSKSFKQSPQLPHIKTPRLTPKIPCGFWTKLSNFGHSWKNHFPPKTKCKKQGK
jgi:hypothetical protein